MSEYAIAVLSRGRGLRVVDAEDGWESGEGPGGGAAAWRSLRDGMLVNLLVPFQWPDAEIYSAAERWAGRVPARIWIFPDSAVPSADTRKATQDATRDVGRWVQRGAQRSSLLADFGFTPAESDAWQRDIASGDPARIKAARAVLEQRLQGRDPEEIQALIQASLRTR